MSSAISTDPARVASEPRPPDSLQPWQFFVLAALACATGVTFIIRGQGVLAVIMLALLMGAVALVGLAVLRAVRPLVGGHDDRTLMIGERTRAALEREKMLTLRSIKELEFDKAMGKLSDEDFREMSGRLRLRAAGLMRQLDAGAGYRAQVEKDLSSAWAGAAPEPAAPATRSCTSCSTQNDPDAKFCKACGAHCDGAKSTNTVGTVVSTVVTEPLGFSPMYPSVSSVLKCLWLPRSRCPTRSRCRAFLVRWTICRWAASRCA